MSDYGESNLPSYGQALLNSIPRSLSFYLTTHGTGDSILLSFAPVGLKAPPFQPFNGGTEMKCLVTKKAIDKCIDCSYHETVRRGEDSFRICSYQMKETKYRYTFRKLKYTHFHDRVPLWCPLEDVK